MEKVPKITNESKVVIPAMMHPMFRVQKAIQDGVEKNLLFRTWGGIGDQICAEPTLRYAIKMFKGCKISLASEIPELFGHLEFDEVIDLKTTKPDYDKYLLFDTITPPDESNMVWLFFSHMLTNCVDFPSMCALRLQLPVADKEIKLVAPLKTSSLECPFLPMNRIVIHPGKHWQSKTFPKSFWDRVIYSLRVKGITPVIIGADSDDNRGTVDVDTDGCLDLRNKLSIMETVGLLQDAAVLLTNDSSPLHMAASGDAWIGYVATCKHPDMITHWRHGEWQWREKNFGKGGIWDIVDFCPNKGDKVEADVVDQDLLESWLPLPSEMAEWAFEKQLEKCGKSL